MGRLWIVKNERRKASHLRKEPIQDYSSSNVIRLFRNGDTVTGEFMYVQRASREVGFIKIRHLDMQGGSSLRVQNADGAATTLLRKQPHDGISDSNVVGHTLEGEMVSGELMFVKHTAEKRGGYIKHQYLRPKGDAVQSGQSLAVLDQAASAQRWAVLDAAHDGAWLRKGPSPEKSKLNILGLVPNGSVVVGDYIYIRKDTGEAGFVRFRDLEQQSPKKWRVRNSEGAISTTLQRLPQEDAAGSGFAVEAEELEGEFVYVRFGEKFGYIKRLYLTALLPKRQLSTQEVPRPVERQRLHGGGLAVL